MNNDIGTPSAQSEGIALPPPRPVGDMTTLTLAGGPVNGDEAASLMSMARLAPSCPGQAALRAAIVHVAPDALTITF